MAFTTANLINIGNFNGYNYWRYDTTDTHATLDSAGYFNNEDDDQIMGVGDIIDVVVWSTAVRSGTISTYGRHIVNAVSSGAVDTSDVTVGTVADTD
jgi:hypothetical protein|tara:strand:+ start:1880 stop:2170 length:291 start_codon:yes stop_codon:yes gene_type:complete